MTGAQKRHALGELLQNKTTEAFYKYRENKEKVMRVLRRMKKDANKR